VKIHTVGQSLIGEQCGAYIVTGVAKSHHVHLRGSKACLQHKLVGKCVSCGRVAEVSYQTLLSARKRGYARCALCNGHAKAGGLQRHATHGLPCAKCYGYPWRRPVNGVCKCGGSHEIETYQAASGMVQSSIVCEVMP
jgi:hypothetical protein